ncbi:MAG TPA: DUF4337 domain-containing protein, partial [Xanthomonadaceae bacterium]|nr:DUF4337 domain-containing protein [Xanthomonadaceae bacterium]
ANSRLNAWVAITIAILATFMAVCKVKDDNICQAMQQAQADKIDHWGYYQARNLREEVASATVDQLTLTAANSPPSQQTVYAATIARYKALAKEQATKKQAVMAQAQDDQKTYDGLNYRDDQFDLSDALLAISISMLAMTALTHKRWLFWMAMFPTGFGTLMGLAGLLGWAIHPDALSNLLS